VCVCVFMCVWGREREREGEREREREIVCVREDECVRETGGRGGAWEIEIRWAKTRLIE